jgi:hypothetical protein
MRLSAGSRGPRQLHAHARAALIEVKSGAAEFRIVGLPAAAGLVTPRRGG